MGYFRDLGALGPGQSCPPGQRYDGGTGQCVDASGAAYHGAANVTVQDWTNTASIGPLQLKYPMFMDHWTLSPDMQARFDKAKVGHPDTRIGVKSFWTTRISDGSNRDIYYNEDTRELSVGKSIAAHKQDAAKANQKALDKARQAAADAAAQTPETGGSSSMLPWILGGAGLLGVILLRRRRK